MNIIAKKHLLSLLMLIVVPFIFIIPLAVAQQAPEKNTAFNQASDEEQASMEKARLLPIPVTFQAKAEHNFQLSADYYHNAPSGQKKVNQPNAPAKSGVIVLHDCQSDRGLYSTLATTIAQQNLHTLSLDLRGYGESIAPGYSAASIKKHAVDIVSYQSDIALLTSYWPDDLLASYEFLRTKVHKSKGVALVASGCSAASAVALAEKIHVSALVLITPQLAYSDKERYKNLIDIPTYFITATHHSPSYATSNELFTWSGSKHSKMQVFKDDKSDHRLLHSHQNLAEDIAHWLKVTLR